MIKKAKVIRDSWCCGWNSGDRRFPTFAIIVLVLGILLLLNETGVLTTKIPWFPSIMIIISLGWIINHYRR